MSLLRFLNVDKYETVDLSVSTQKMLIIQTITPQKNNSPCCYRCNTPLDSIKSSHWIKARDLSIMNFQNYIKFKRRKGFCSKCHKYRSEHVSFLSETSPHITKQFEFWLGKIAEITSIKKGAELGAVDKSTLQRIDFKRLKKQIQHYKIPSPKRISVDEVYANRQAKDRDERFVTVITDLNTRKVIWVSQSRKKEALEQFFILLGEKACQKIEVIAMDQHLAYKKAAEKYCPKATIVWDRFHLMRSFEQAVNDTRKHLIKLIPKNKRSKLIAGRYRFVFLKKEKRRTASESQHMKKVIEENKLFNLLEIIKERMFSFFDSSTEEEALGVIKEIGKWILESGFPPLKRWFMKFRERWDTVKNYFTHRVTTALSEGINNVIKALKRQAYGYRNMEYFRLKIMQKVGYLNHKHLEFPLKPLERFESEIIV